MSFSSFMYIGEPYKYLPEEQIQLQEKNKQCQQNFLCYAMHLES